MHEKIADIYYKEVSKYKSPTKEEEQALFIRYEEIKKKLTEESTDELLKEKQTIRDQISTNYLKFVVKVAKKKTRNQYLLLDLISEGNVGLLRSIDKFDVNRGLRFLTYAAYWIEVEMLEYLRKLDTVHLTSQAKKEQQQLRKQEDLLFSKGELTSSKLNEVVTLSFDSNTHSPIDHLLNRIDIWYFIQYSDLSLKEKLLILYFFGLRGTNKSLLEITDLFYDLDGTQLSIKDIKQMKDRCISKLKESLFELGITDLEDLLPGFPLSLLMMLGCFLIPHTA